MTVLAVLVAGLLAAFLAGLLLVSGARPAPAPRTPAAKPRPETPTVELPPAQDPPPAPPAEEAAADPAEPADEEGPFPPGSVLEGVAVLEAGTPIPRVLLHEIIPAAEGGAGGEGNWEIDLDADLPVDRSAVPGEFRVRWKKPRAEVVLLVLGRTAECVAAEGAAIVGLEERGEVVRFTPGVPARLVFRDLPGGPVRLLLEVGEWSPAGASGSPGIALLDGDGNPPTSAGSSIRLVGVEAVEPGRTVATAALELPVLDRTKRAAGDRRVAVVTVPFHEPLHLLVADLKDGMRIPLVPLRPTVTGLLSPPPVPGLPAGLAIARAGEAASGVTESLSIRRSLAEDGTLRIFDLPEGEWALHVMRGTPEGLRWGRRAVRKEAGPLDLGLVEANGYAGVRMRLLDEEGRPMPQASLSVTRMEEREVGREAVFSLLERPGPRGGHILLRSDVLWIQPGAEARDPEGWYEIPDLAPGTRYRVQDMGRGGLFAEITTPAENGGWVEVELRRREPVPAKEEK